jgi:penicillin-binding protein 1A
MNIPQVLRPMPLNALIAVARAVARAVRCVASHKKPFRLLSGLINGLLIVCMVFVAQVATFDPPLLEQYPIEQTLRGASTRPLLLLSADGEPFARRGDCVSEPVTLAELPRHLIDAVLAMEDRRFYSHFGIDLHGIVRAGLRNYEAGAIREGGSTISQQLAKISYLSNEQTLDRKAKEALLAVWLEMRLTKDQILERYLNSAYFGEGCSGVRAAARHFFDKPVGDISLAEAALLVALLGSPSHLTRNFDEAHQRARLVVRAMVGDGRLDAARLENIQPAVLNPAREDQDGAYYADWLATSLQSEIEDTHSRQPILVRSTFDPALQRIAEEAVRLMLEKEGGRRVATQAALVAMRPDGRVLAMVGGTSWLSSQFNRAVQAKRQPGSSFKTFVYLAALRAGVRLDAAVADEPISIDGWEPKNFARRHRGVVTLGSAFASSINTVAVKVSEAVGHQAVIAAARDLGIISPLAANPSLALGTSEVSLLELTAAYAAIAAGAYPVRPWGVIDLDAGTDPGDGTPPSDAGLWKLAEADDMRNLLARVVQSGSGRAARLPIPAYGKTGTSQGYRDAWFIGFAGNLVVGVWVGNDDDTPMKGVTGGSLPARIWRDFMHRSMKADSGFERRRPQVSAFPARNRRPVERALYSASLSSLVVSSDPPKAEPRPSRPAFAEQRPDRRVGARGARQISREFEKQLNAMGWPGQ